MKKRKLIPDETVIRKICLFRGEKCSMHLHKQGVAMLSGIIHSTKSIEMNIAIMRAFVEMRKLAHSNKRQAAEIKKLIDKVGEHDVQLAGIYDTIEDLMDKKAGEKQREDRIRIGFKLKK